MMLQFSCAPGIVGLSSSQANGDDVPASAASPGISFEDAIARILARSPTIEAQRKTLDSVRAQALPSYFFLAPELQIDSQQQKQVVYSIGSEQVSRTLELRGNVNLLRFGADLAQLRSSNAQIRRQEAVVDSTVLQAEADGVQALVELIQRRKDRLVLERAVQMQSEAHEIARLRYARGLLPQQDADKVEIDLDNARSLLAEGRIAEAAAASSLTALLGNADVRIEWPWQERLTKLDPAQFTRARGFDVSRVPEWIGAKEFVEYQDQQAKRSYSLMLPSLDASFAYGFYETDALTSSYGSTQGPGWTATVGVTLPLFDRLIDYSTARSSVYLRGAAEAAQVGTERLAKSEYETGRDSFEIAVRSAVARERTLGLSERLFRDSVLRFKSGRASSNDLLLDETRLTTSETLATQSWATAHLSLARFCHSLGRSIASCFAR